MYICGVYICGAYICIYVVNVQIMFNDVAHAQMMYDNMEYVRMTCMYTYFISVQTAFHTHVCRAQKLEKHRIY